MFLKTAGFKKLLKEAYKGYGLHIGGTYDTVILAGSYWAIEVDRNEIPKEKLAAIIEIFGRLPNPGEQYLLNKETEQMELDSYNDYHVLESVRGLPVRTEWTRIIIHTTSGTDMRVLQQRGSGKISLINEIFTEILDNTESMPGHGNMEGPLLNGGRPYVYFANEIMAIGIFTPEVSGQEEKLIRHLECFDINGEQERQDNGGSDVSEDEDEKEKEDA